MAHSQLQSELDKLVAQRRTVQDVVRQLMCSSAEHRTPDIVSVLQENGVGARAEEDSIMLVMPDSTTVLIERPPVIPYH